MGREVRYRLSSVPQISVSTFINIDDALGLAKTLLEGELTVSIKILKEGDQDEHDATTRSIADAEGRQSAGSAGTAGKAEPT